MIYSQRSAKDGFTLIEIMVAIAIVAILTVAVPNFMGYLQTAKKSKATTTLRTFDQAITLFNVQTGQYPQSLRDLIRRPSDEKIARKWQDGGYLKGKEVPEDPWGNSYRYRLTPGQEHPYELYSYGPKGKDAPKAEWFNVWTLD